MITRLDRTYPIAAGLLAVGRGVPSTRGRKRDATRFPVFPVADAWCVDRMHGPTNPRDVQSRYNPGAGPAAGAHAR